MGPKKFLMYFSIRYIRERESRGPILCVNLPRIAVMLGGTALCGFLDLSIECRGSSM